MIQVLIVDDSIDKAKRIRSILEPYISSDKVGCTLCSTVTAAKDALCNTQFELLILDVQLPMREGEDPRPLAGVELLREVHSRTVFKKPHSIVGLTAFPDALLSATAEFADELWSVILFSPASEEWADRIIRKVEYLLEHQRCIELRAPAEYDLGIVAALSTPEFEKVLSLGDWRDINIVNDDAKYVATEFRSGNKKIRVVATVAPQMGMPASAVAATKLITHFHPRYLAMVGITAGVEGRVNFGDVVIADPSWDWGSGKRTDKDGGRRFEPEPLPERLHPHLKTLFLDVQRDIQLLSAVQSSWPGKKQPNNLRLHVGPCASGSAVVADENIIEEIREHNRKLIGVDMEAYGVMHAAANAPKPRPFAFSIKAVCDFATKEKDDSVQDYAAFVSAVLLQRIALKYFAQNS
ncbi:MAG: histidine kinase [Elusimicrobiota bacterium]|nr:histidine kinase [Elusimicrobiota bacterium]